MPIHQASHKNEHPPFGHPTLHSLPYPHLTVGNKSNAKKITPQVAPQHFNQQATTCDGWVRMTSMSVPNFARPTFSFPFISFLHNHACRHNFSTPRPSTLFFLNASPSTELGSHVTLVVVFGYQPNTDYGFLGQYPRPKFLVSAT